ncbi:hypothetical protein PsorP6_018036 [Peronosclerospora sorghi]|uniref:Uncharacterized protein n=1 Tax=Peronosclerospora sorghi TaxID=230839 RepID=A0ACC0WD38_9STRA|nr:hypothetical protein PsorP6_018036 [Peronosclerospora sorghi]
MAENWYLYTFLYSSCRTIKTIMVKCRKLHSLSVGYCAITDEALIALLENANHDQLLRYIGSEAHNLQELSLCGVKSVSDDSIVAAIYSNMGARNELLDSTVSQPSLEDNPEPERKRLKKIDFRYSSAVKIYSQFAIGSLSVTKEAAAAIRKRYPDLQVTF